MYKLNLTLIDKLVKLSYEVATEEELRETYMDTMYALFGKMTEEEQLKMLEDLS